MVLRKTIQKFRRLKQFSFIRRITVFLFPFIAFRNQDKKAFILSFHYYHFFRFQRVNRRQRFVPISALSIERNCKKSTTKRKMINDNRHEQEYTNELPICWPNENHFKTLTLKVFCRWIKSNFPSKMWEYRYMHIKLSCRT